MLDSEIRIARQFEAMLRLVIFALVLASGVLMMSTASHFVSVPDDENVATSTAKSQLRLPIRQDHGADGATTAALFLARF